MATELKWVDGDKAATWETGIKVLIRRKGFGRTEYEADNWHRPDWVADKLTGLWIKVEWCMLPEE